MKSKNIILKVLVIIIILLPVASWSGCKKQARCGCGKDVVSTIDSMLIDHSTIVFTAEGGSAYFQIGYNTYYFCNAKEMYPKYTSMNADDQVYISGDLFWECQYLMNSSNNYNYRYYKVYNIEVTLLEPNLYGKK